MTDNIILRTDSYKFSHYRQYPPRTQRVYSYFESRGGAWDVVLFFGLQAILKKYLVGQVVTREKIDEADAFISQHIGPGVFNRAGWEIILNEYGGRLPVRIKAVPEGTILEPKNVLMTVENTDERLFWLTNYLETLLVQVWYPTTVATNSLMQKILISEFLKKTGDPAGLPFKLHDFGFRGVSSVESAGLGGCAHLVNFMGTDTVEGIVYARDYYGCPMAGFSIPAAEHSTITSWGREYEVDAMRNMLTQYPTGLVACVSDSYDIFAAARNLWGTTLKEAVLARDGCLVVRPDSGDPAEVVPTVMEILMEKFGFTTNEKGYKVLNPKVRMIQGDGINFDMIAKIYNAMEARKLSGDNLAFGSGGALLQKMDRDTLSFAFKASAIRVADSWKDVYKEPITSQSKNSKKGLLKLIKVEDVHKTVRVEEPGDDILEEVYCNGEITREYTLDQIRQRATLG